LPASTIIAIVTDTHIGGSTAIAPPKFTIHTGRKGETNTVTYNESQQWLYTCWLDFWDHIKQRAGIRGKYRKNRLIIFHLGDAMDGDHHHSTQLIPEPSDQINAAIDLLRVPLAMADRMYLTYGTDVHNGGAGAYEIALAAELGNAVRHDWFYSVDVDGVTFDLGHHGRAGKRDWTSSAAGYAVEIATEYIKDGMTPPRYILRGHNHTVDDSGQKVAYSRAIACPSWQLRTSFGNRVKGGRARADIGGLLLDTAQPDYMEFSRARYMAPADKRTYEVV
jgi:hypothetical protein